MTDLLFSIDNNLIYFYGIVFIVGAFYHQECCSSVLTTAIVFVANSFMKKLGDVMQGIASDQAFLFRLEAWYLSWALLDALIIFVIWKLHTRQKLIASFVTTYTMGLFTVLIGVQLLGYLNRVLFGNGELINFIYPLAIPTINICIGSLILIELTRDIWIDNYVWHKLTGGRTLEENPNLNQIIKDCAKL